MMKALQTLFLTAILLFAVTITPEAKEVPKNQARQVAKNFYFETAHTYYSPIAYGEIAIDGIYTRNYDGQTAFYIINLKPDGYVIVSAEDTYNPILGYSLKSSYDENRKNKVFESWITTYAEKIDYLRANDIAATDEMEARWAHYLNAGRKELAGQAKGRDIDPLLTSTWNQDYPYNAMCPEDEDGPGGHVYAGCVATAMSIIMYHYKYPEHGYGQKSYYIYPYGTQSVDFESTYYMWNAMTDEISGSSPEHSIQGIAELQYHCGVAVEMGYSPDGSGTYSYLVPNAIKNHFGYSSNATYMEKDNYSLTEWQNMIIEDLENNHPLYYSGNDGEGGHAFVLDGAQGDDMFHFNFGWSGYMNGFYYLEGSGAVGGFNQGQAIVKNFYPDEEEYPWAIAADTLPYLGGTLNDAGTPNESYPAGEDCSWLLTPPSEVDEVENYSLNFLDFELEDGADFVKVYDGPTADADLLGEFTGSTLPSSMETTADSVLIEFTADDNETTHTGFRLEYIASRPEYCDFNQYTDPSGDFNDGSGDMNYINNSFCQFQIMPPDANEVLMTFNEFDLGEGDVLKVYQTEPTTLLEELTGSELPDPITSTSGAMMLVFQTDNMYAGGGFDVSYQIDNTGISNEKQFDRFLAFPNPANKLLNIIIEDDFQNEVIATMSTLDGKEVFSKAFSPVNGSLNETIDISHYDKGIYLLTLQGNKGVAARKVIIQ